MKINNEDIIEYCENFFGYGNLKSDILVLGLEEGYGKNIENEEGFTKKVKYVLKQLRANNGHTADFLELHREFAPSQYQKIMLNKEFSRYWIRGATRVIMNIKGDRKNKTSEIVQYFKDTIIKDCALLDFRPLPCTSIEEWKYDKYKCTKNNPDLQKRELYEKWIDPIRIKKIRKLIDENNYNAVLFFGIKEKEQFGKIIGLNFKDGKTINYNGKSFGGSYLKILKKKNTNYFLMPQPNTVGSSHDFFNWAGIEIKKILKHTNI